VHHYGAVLNPAALASGPEVSTASRHGHEGCGDARRGARTPWRTAV